MDKLKVRNKRLEENNRLLKNDLFFYKFLTVSLLIVNVSLLVARYG